MISTIADLPGTGMKRSEAFLIAARMNDTYVPTLWTMIEKGGICIQL